MRTRRWNSISLLLALSAASLCRPARGLTLGVDATRFTLDGKPTFLLGCSYYAGLGGSRENIGKDLDDLQRHGFNWIRVWATWSAYDKDVSAVDSQGKARQPYLDQLRWIVTECDRRNMAVDVTLTRGDPGLQTLAAHRQAVRTIVEALKDHRNWWIDLSNERNIGDKRFASLEDLRNLRDLVKSIDPQRLVTASHGGDVTAREQRLYFDTAHLDFLSIHLPRDPDSPGKTLARTRQIRARLREQKDVPLMYDEPFRRGYSKWQPAAEDFRMDLAAAREGGAAGWCFHNGGQRDTPDHRPARSFDLSEKRLFEQLDAQERRFLESLRR